MVAAPFYLKRVARVVVHPTHEVLPARTSKRHAAPFRLPTNDLPRRASFCLGMLAGLPHAPRLATRHQPMTLTRRTERGNIGMHEMLTSLGTSKNGKHPTQVLNHVRLA